MALSESEVRSNLIGNHTARVIFAVEQDRVAILHGFIKKSQKMPKTDIDLARDRLKRLRASR